MKFGVCAPRPGTALAYTPQIEEGKQQDSNITCRAQLGRYPLNITINQKLYFQTKNEE